MFFRFWLTPLVQHFSDILPDLSKTFDASELSDMIIDFSDAVTQSPGKGVIWKLLLHLRTVKSVVFEDSTARAALVPSLIRWIKPHLGKYAGPESVNIGAVAAQDSGRILWLECLRIAVTVLAVMLDQLSESSALAAQTDQRTLDRERENIDLVFSCLPK